MTSGFTPDEEAQAERLGVHPYKRYSHGQAAKVLQVLAADLRRLREANKIEHLRVGRRVYYLGGHIARFRAEYMNDNNSSARAPSSDIEQAVMTRQLPNNARHH